MPKSSTQNAKNNATNMVFLFPKSQWKKLKTATPHDSGPEYIGNEHHMHANVSLRK